MKLTFAYLLFACLIFDTLSQNTFGEIFQYFRNNRNCLRKLKRGDGCDFKQFCRDNVEDKTKSFLVDKDDLGACPRVDSLIDDVPLPTDTDPCVCPYCDENGVRFKFVFPRVEITTTTTITF